MTLKEVSR